MVQILHFEYPEMGVKLDSCEAAVSIQSFMSSQTALLKRMTMNRMNPRFFHPCKYQYKTIVRSYM